MEYGSTDYSRYTKLGDIFESYAMYDVDQNLVTHLINECANFLHYIDVDNEAIPYFSLEVLVSQDQSFIDINGGNLMSTLWLIDVFPPNPKKYITEKVCIFENKEYIYDPSRKSLKIKKHGEKKVRITK